MKSRIVPDANDQRKLECSLEHRARCECKSSALPAKKQPLTVAIIYEGKAGLIRANELWFRLAVEFQGQVLREASAWNFALLRDARLRDQATLQASRANIVIISPADGNELPEHVGDWLDSWLPCDARNAASASFTPSCRSRACLFLRFQPATEHKRQYLPSR
jgi:hypothetical protein